MGLSPPHEVDDGPDVNAPFDVTDCNGLVTCGVSCRHRQPYVFLLGGSVPPSRHQTAENR
jgi:hypothetical protein